MFPRRPSSSVEFSLDFRVGREASVFFSRMFRGLSYRPIRLLLSSVEFSVGFRVNASGFRFLPWTFPWTSVRVDETSEFSAGFREASVFFHEHIRRPPCGSVRLHFSSVDIFVELRISFRDFRFLQQTWKYLLKCRFV